MKTRTISFTTFVLLIASLLVISGIQGVSAAALEENATCSNATLKGSYGYYRTGNFNEFGPYAAVGIMFFDGNGTAKRRQTVNFNGHVEKNHGEFQYQVARDCTGKFLSNGNEFAALTVVEGGRELYILHEFNQTVFSVAKKINSTLP